MIQIFKSHKTADVFSSLSKNHLLFILLSISIGVIVFGNYFDFTIVEPNNTAWILRLQGDHSQHYIGSVAFRADEWHFPLTKTTYINYPEGISIVYTDSNPLLAFIAKIFRSVFLPTYQYTGAWYLICFSLQSLLGYLLIQKITQNSIFGLLAGALFCLLPPIVHRTGHENLMAFWIILWALYVFIHTELSIYKKSLLFFIVISISSLTHAYLCIMVLFISGTWYLQQAIILLKEKQLHYLLTFILANIVYGLAFVIILWSFGYFYNTPENSGLMGFGYFSMNLTAPLNPVDNLYSSFINETAITEGQYEGFQYWGLGVIFLLLFTVLKYTKKYFSDLKGSYGLFLLSTLILILLFKNSEVTFYQKSLVALLTAIYCLILYVLYKEKAENYLLLFVPATICFFLAVSNTITIGHSILLDYHLNENGFFSGFFRTVRSSGRLFWVTTHVLLLSALFLLFKITSPRKGILILAIIVLLQIIDLYKISYVIDSKNKEYASSLSDINKKTILACNSVRFIGELNMEVADFAILNQKPINNFYTVHNVGSLTASKLSNENLSFQENKLNVADLTLFRLTDLPLNKQILGDVFDNKFLKLSTLENGKLVAAKNKLLRKSYDSLYNIIDVIKKESVVIFSIKKLASFHNDTAFCKSFDILFQTHLSDIKLNQPYIAVFYHGALVIEKTDQENTDSVEYSTQLDDHTLYIKSTATEREDAAVISIDDFDYSTNTDGLNIVSISKYSGNNFTISTGNIGSFDKIVH